MFLYTKKLQVLPHFFFRTPLNGSHPLVAVISCSRNPSFDGRAFLMEGHFAFFVNGLHLINLIFWSKLQVLVAAIEHHSPAGNYIFKVNNRNTRTWPHSGVFTVKFGHYTPCSSVRAGKYRLGKKCFFKGFLSILHKLVLGKTMSFRCERKF